MSFFQRKKMISLLILIVLISTVVFTGCGPAAKGIQAQLVGAAGTTITDDSNVVFNSILNDLSRNINYNTATGEFTIEKPGNYEVAWWVATASSTAINVSFTVTLDGSPVSTAPSLIVTEKVSGEALITVEETPATVTLVNVTNEDIVLADTPVQANMVIRLTE